MPHASHSQTPIHRGAIVLHQVQLLVGMVEYQMVIKVPSKDWHLVAPAALAASKTHSVNGDGLGSHLRPHGAGATLLCSSGTITGMACSN